MFTGDAQRQRWVGNLAKGSGVAAAATVSTWIWGIECVSSLDEDEIHRHHHSEFSSTKPRNGGTNNNNNTMGPTAIAPANSIHELLECPVCTNSMYPPIHPAEREAELLKEQLDHLKDQLNEVEFCGVFAVTSSEISPLCQPRVLESEVREARKLRSNIIVEIDD